MCNVYWTLGSKKYDTYEEFVVAVTEWNQLIDPGRSAWAPDQVVAQGPVTVSYEALWKDEDDTIELTIGEPGQTLTMGRLLFELHNATVAFFADADARYFEGLAQVDGKEYELLVGS
jgi:hypothetical protein